MSATPPDSGEMIGVCDLDGFPKSWPEHDDPHRPLPSCVNWEPVAVAQMEGKPDSGEREVCGATFTRDGKMCVCQEMRHHDPDHAMQMAERRRERKVPRDPDTLFSIRRGLAQRILAALEKAWPLTDAESAEVKALADGLRKIISCH